MKSFWALCLKEIQCFFLSPMAYLTMMFFLLLMGFGMWYLMDMLADGMQSDNVIQALFGESLFFWVAMLIMIPVITMRLLAEEKKMGTIEGLLTAPITDHVVVLAKYAAALLFFVVLWLPTAAYGFVIRYFDPGLTLDWRPLLCAYGGTLLVGAFFLAIGLLASSLTRNQVVASIVCFTMISLIFFSGFIPYLSSSPEIRRASAGFSPILHMMDFSRGILDSRTIVLYVSGTALLLFATVRVVESGKWK